jgi:hypothetical protein
MKRDVVLTMNEYLDECCALWKPVSPPAPEARHVPITTEGDIGPKAEVHGGRCDRWGHPCPGCVEPKLPTHTDSEDFPSANK